MNFIQQYKKRILNYGIALALLSLLLWLIYRQLTQSDSITQQWEDLKISWQAANKYLVVLVLLLAPINWLVEAIKWKMLLYKIQPISLRRAYSSVLTGVSFAFVTPGKVGDFAGRILYVKNSNKLRAAIATLLSNMSQAIATFIFGLIALLGFYFYFPLGNWHLWLIIACFFGLAILFVIYWKIEKISTLTENIKWLKNITIALRIFKRYSGKDLSKVLLLSMLRFVIYNTQFCIIIQVLGAGISWYLVPFAAALMFWMIAVIPSFMIADLGVRGYIAGLIFTETGLAQNNLSILSGSYFIWLLNIVLPAILGSLFLFTIRFVEKE